MKGVIVNCLAELVETKFGVDKWKEALEKAGLPRESTFLVTQDVNDAAVIRVLDSLCKVLNISLQQAADAFGDYWVNVYAPKLYAPYYKDVNSAKEFLLKMDDVHRISTKNIPNAHPPRFDYEWKDDKTLIMTYMSHRNLIDIMIGLIKGVGKYFKEDLQVKKLSDTQVEIVFP